MLRSIAEPRKNCYVGMVPYGYITRIQWSDLKDVYTTGLGNPSAEEEIKRFVRGGGVIAEEDGILYRVADNNGQLVREPLQS